MPASCSRLRASFFLSFFSFLSRTLCSSGDAAPWKQGHHHQGFGSRCHRGSLDPVAHAGPLVPGSRGKSCRVGQVLHAPAEDPPPRLQGRQEVPGRVSLGLSGKEALGPVMRSPTPQTKQERSPRSPDHPGGQTQRVHCDAGRSPGDPATAPALPGRPLVLAPHTQRPQPPSRRARSSGDPLVPRQAGRHKCQSLTTFVFPLHSCSFRNLLKQKSCFPQLLLLRKPSGIYLPWSFRDAPGDSWQS